MSKTRRYWIMAVATHGQEVVKGRLFNTASKETADKEVEEYHKRITAAIKRGEDYKFSPRGDINFYPIERLELHHTNNPDTHESDITPLYIYDEGYI